MRLKTQKRGGLAVLYHLNLSADETRKWANKPGSAWPCSKLSGQCLWVAVDQNGLYDVQIDGNWGDQDIPPDELAACVGDHLPENCRHLWPVWDKELEEG